MSVLNVTIASVVKDAEFFLPKTVECWLEIADRVRVLDNMSSDATTDILKDAADRHPDFKWATCTTPMDGNESEVRASLWDYARDGAEWVVHCDADQTFASDFRPFLAETDANLVKFRVYDLWSATHYRSDAWWRVRPWWAAVNVKNHAETEWKWSNRGWHSGHLPRNAAEIRPVADVPDEMSILHYGYATPELREAHHAAYVARQAHLTQGERWHAETIKDKYAKLKPLPFTPRWSLL